MNHKSTRRQFLLNSALTGAAIPLAQWLEETAEASPLLRIRYGLDTPEGKKNLAVYADGFSKMQELLRTNPTDPRSLAFQYRIHMYPDNWDGLVDSFQKKAAQLAELDAFFYPDAKLATDPYARLGEVLRLGLRKLDAEKIWGQCPHQASDFFVWHRMYIYFFEQCIRALTNTPDFTLPYWAYSDKSQRAIPADFRSPVVKGAQNPLWRARNVLLNDAISSNPIEDRFIVGVGDYDYWAKTTFAEFSAVAELIPHNAVHVLLGHTGFEMSTVALAPRDAIFWVHHCEIDRIWYSWAKAGGEKPKAAAWFDNDYYFVDGTGKLVSLKGRDVIGTEQLGYSYDRAIPKPPSAFQKKDEVASQQVQIAEVPAAAAEKIVVPNERTRITLASNEKLNVLMSSSDQTAKSWSLVIEGLHTSRTISAILDVYVNLSDNADEKAIERFRAGTIALFGHVPDGEKHEHGDNVIYKFDITELVKQLRAEGRWRAAPNVTIIISAGELKGGTVQFDRMAVMAR